MNALESAYSEVIDSIGGRAKLICVSKTKPSDMIESLYNLGQRDFGENKVQELLQKSQDLSHLTEIRWHFIGHLQSNKINQLLSVTNLYSIHSIDRLSLLEKVVAKKPKNTLHLFIQINTSGESEKGGFEADEEILVAVDIIQNSDGYHFSGFMTIGKIRTDDFEADARASFSKLQSLKQSHFPKAELSMGMSSDYKIAIEYDSNWIRVGSKVFGAR